MKRAVFNRLSFKLPVFVAAVILIVASGLGTLNYLTGRADALGQVHERLDLVAHSRVKTLQEWYQQVSISVQSKAQSPDTVSATEAFITNYGRLDETGRTDIREAYTTLNDFPPGERQNLDQASGFSFYHVAHADYHPAFRQFNETNQFYDTFILDLDGNIIYSVFKEDDFARDITVGDLAESGIANAFRLALASEAGEVNFSQFAPYAPSAGAMAAFAASPITNDAGDMIGVMIVQVNIDDLNTIINDPVGLGETAEAFLISNEGQAILQGRFEGGPQPLSSVPLTDHIVETLRGNDVTADMAQGISFDSVSAVTQWVTLGGNQYAMIVEKATDEILAPVYKQRNRTFFLSLGATFLMSLLAWLFIRTITQSIDSLQTQMRKISEGDYTVDVTSVRRGDEIGDIGRTLLEFRAKLEMAQAQAEEREGEQIQQQVVLDTLRNGLIDLAEGDLTKPISQKFDDQYESLRADFNETLRTLSDAISNVIRVTGSISHGANEISQANDDLSNRTEHQAATLEETAAALDELTASVKSAADGAKSVEAIVIEAQSEAEESGKIVGDAIAAMTEIEKSSAHISQIIGVIDDIAFQTNLLALNAGVEAARAGDAGKGFAVVASEVRALAQRSSEAAKEIKSLISGSAKQVERGVDLVGGAGTALGNIVQRVNHISELIRNIANGSSEQALGLGEINVGVNQLDQVTQQNAAMVEEATAASHVLKSDATQLEDLVMRFKTKTGATDAGFVQNRAPTRPDFAQYSDDDDVISVQFTHTKDTIVDPEPVPIAVGDVPASSNQMPPSSSKTNDEWIDF